jgi:hypothetical protein
MKCITENPSMGYVSAMQHTIMKMLNIARVLNGT